MKMLVFAVATITLAIGNTTVKEGIGDGEAKSPDGNAAISPRTKAMLRHFGGFLEDRRTQKGRVAIVNAQNLAKKEWFSEAGAIFAKDLMIAVEIRSGKFSMSDDVANDEVVVFVIEDDVVPMSLIAPESRWAAVNVKRLKADAEPYFKSRVMKEVARVATQLLGGADSQYPMCIMGCVTKASDLDKYPGSQLPVDVVGRMRNNLAKLGIVPYSIATYRKACQEGWAPAPTNEYQRAIWEETRKMPEKPIQIKFDPKKGR